MKTTSLLVTLAMSAVLALGLALAAAALGWTGPLATLSAVVVGLALTWPLYPLVLRLLGGPPDTPDHDRDGG
jgi:hypothetical protein